VATKRARRARERGGITAAALAAWRRGDFSGLNTALGIRPWQASPFDAVPKDAPRGGETGLYAESWPRAAELRRQLIELAGPLGCQRG
jgi:hypothetical protein